MRSTPDNSTGLNKHEPVHADHKTVTVLVEWVNSAKQIIDEFVQCHGVRRNDWKLVSAAKDLLAQTPSFKGKIAVNANSLDRPMEPLSEETADQDNWETKWDLFMQSRDVAKGFSTSWLHDRVQDFMLAMEVKQENTRKTARHEAEILIFELVDRAKRASLSLDGLQAIMAELASVDLLHHRLLHLMDAMATGQENIHQNARAEAGTLLAEIASRAERCSLLRKSA